MARSLSLLRRRANLVDVGVRVRAGVSAYHFQSATNFDGSFATFATVPATGMLSNPSLEGGTEGNRGWTRFVFDPADYSLDDTKPMWLKIIPVDLDGADGSAEAAHLVLPYSSQPNRTVVLAGTAKNAAAGSAMELQLPGQCHSLVFAVEGTTPVKLSTEPGGYEYKVLTEPNEYLTLSTVFPTFTQLFVRGDGVDTAFSAMFSLRNNPIS